MLCGFANDVHPLCVREARAAHVNSSGTYEQNGHHALLGPSLIHVLLWWSKPVSQLFKSQSFKAQEKKNSLYLLQIVRKALKIELIGQIIVNVVYLFIPFDPPNLHKNPFTFDKL